MHKAQKEIKKVMPQIDIVIEVMDARIPFSSENPAVAQLREQRPCIKVLNKSDLADPEVTRLWLDALERESGVKAIALVAEQKGQARQLLDLVRRLVPERNTELKPTRIMILGIPNVGKSTLMNALAGKVLAKVGNEPAVTKNQQRIRLGDGMYLSDTPGILWPRMEDQNSGYRLAISGAIRNTAMEYEDVALYAAAFLLQAYPDALLARYKLKELPRNETELLEIIGSKRGGLRAGGEIDLHKAAEVLLHDYRAGAIGRISLETPAMVEAARLERQRLDEERRAAEEGEGGDD
jgi:ribosome biogenesis GTPase A